MSLIRRFLAHERGATIIEFAAVAPIFFLVMFAILEFGLIRFTQVAVEAAMSQASRAASIGLVDSSGDRVTTLRNLVQQKTRGLIGADQVTISATVVGTGTTTPPEICLTNPPSTPTECPTGTPYEDTNMNGKYDGPGGLSLGNAGDLVEVRISFPWRVQFPFVRSLFGPNGVFMITSSTVIKNEP